MSQTGDFVLMQKNKKDICILGGNDDLTNSFYSYCKKKFHKTIYINLLNLYNSLDTPEVVKK